MKLLLLLRMTDHAGRKRVSPPSEVHRRAFPLRIETYGTEVGITPVMTIPQYQNRARDNGIYSASQALSVPAQGLKWLRDKSLVLPKVPLLPPEVGLRPRCLSLLAVG
jgi:hypothetical protein